MNTAVYNNRQGKLKLLTYSNAGIVFVLIGDMFIPYTRRTNSTAPQVGANKTALYNLVSNRWDTVNDADILTFQYWCDDDGKPRNTIPEQMVKRMIADVDECSTMSSIAISRDEIIRIRFKYLMTTTKFEVLKHFKFKYTLEQLANASDATMGNIREQYMDIIRDHRDTSFKELDQLEQEAREQGSSDEDIQDIDTIKQMFRDIPQDTDLNNFNDIRSLYEFWPSLLQPKPPALLSEKHFNVLERSIAEHAPTPRDVFIQFVNKVDNLNHLNVLMSQLGNLQNLPGDCFDILNAKRFKLKQLKHISNVS
jgi:hypothetical protein